MQVLSLTQAQIDSLPSTERDQIYQLVGANIPCAHAQLIHCLRSEDNSVYLLRERSHVHDVTTPYWV